MQSGLTYTTAALLAILLAACGGEVAPAAPKPVSKALEYVGYDELFETLRVVPLREREFFFGDLVWAIDEDDRVFRSRDGGRHWQLMELPEPGAIEWMSFSANGRDGMLLNAHSQLMRTADGGDSWTISDLLKIIGDRLDTSWDPEEAQLEFDASFTTGIWIDYCQVMRTTDGGASWVPHSASLMEHDDEFCVVAARRHPETGAWAANVRTYNRSMVDGEYLQTSDDDGLTWTEHCGLDEVGFYLDHVLPCQDFETDDPFVRAAIMDWGIGSTFTGFDAIKAWDADYDVGIFIDGHMPIPDNVLPYIEKASFRPDSISDRIWAGGYDELAYTDDQGEIWEIVATELPDNEQLDFSLGKERGYGIREYGYLGLTENLGRTWQILNDQRISMYDLAVLPDARRVLVATGDGVKLVDDKTHEWQQATGFGDISTYRLIVADEAIWALSEDGHMHRSTDAGTSWTKLDVDAGGYAFGTENHSCTDDVCLLAEYAEIGILRAEPPEFEYIDLEARLPAIRDDSITKLLLDAETERAWLALESGDLYGSDDSGRSWQKLASLPGGIFDFSRSPEGSGYIASAETPAYLWSDDGESFQHRNFPVDSDGYAEICWITDTTALLATYEEERGDYVYFASLDSGKTWHPTDPVRLGGECGIRGGLLNFVDRLARPL